MRRRRIMGGGAEGSQYRVADAVSLEDRDFDILGAVLDRDSERGDREHPQRHGLGLHRRQELRLFVRREGDAHRKARHRVRYPVPLLELERRPLDSLRRCKRTGGRCAGWKGPSSIWWEQPWPIETSHANTN